MSKQLTQCLPIGSCLNQTREFLDCQHRKDHGDEVASPARRLPSFNACLGFGLSAAQVGHLHGHRLRMCASPCTCLSKATKCSHVTCGAVCSCSIQHSPWDLFHSISQAAECIKARTRTDCTIDQSLKELGAVYHVISRGSQHCIECRFDGAASGG